MMAPVQAPPLPQDVALVVSMCVDHPLVWHVVVVVGMLMAGLVVLHGVAQVDQAAQHQVDKGRQREGSNRPSLASRWDDEEQPEGHTPVERNSKELH